MLEKNSVMCAGESGLIVTDENGKSFLVDCIKKSLGENEKVLFSNRITRFCGEEKVTDQEREKIISKILELDKNAKWQIE